MKRMTCLMGIAMVMACGPELGPPGESQGSATDDGDDDGPGRSESGPAATTQPPDGTTTDAPSSDDGRPATSGAADTGGTDDTGPLACVDHTTIDGCRDAGCMASIGRNWVYADDGSTCRDPPRLLGCSQHIACFQPAFACPLFAANHFVEMVEGCMPTDHQECAAPARPAPDCP